jgi:hypothetical protein
MKNQKPMPNPDDIELRPDAWERFVDAVKRIARHPPIEKPKPKRGLAQRRSAVHKRKR